MSIKAASQSENKSNSFARAVLYWLGLYLGLLPTLPGNTT